MPAPAVSIVIPTWNGRHILQEFLPSVLASAAHYARSGAADVEVLVVDDGSADDTASWLAVAAAESAVPLRTIRHERNRGFGAACNTGVEHARHALVLLLNNDVEIAPDTLAPLTAHFARPGARVFAVHCQAIDLASGRAVGQGQRGRFARGFLRVHERYEAAGGRTPPHHSMFATGGSAMFDRRLFLELGGFDALFAPFYYEDVELSLRAWRRGWEVRYEPASRIRHRFSSTIGAAGQARIGRISQRNRLLLHWIHLEDPLWLAQHLAWLPILVLTSLLTFRPTFALGFFDALRHVRSAHARRRREQAVSIRTIREVVRLCQ